MSDDKIDNPFEYFVKGTEQMEKEQAEWKAFADACQNFINELEKENYNPMKPFGDAHRERKKRLEYIEQHRITFSHEELGDYTDPRPMGIDPMFIGYDYKFNLGPEWDKTNLEMFPTTSQDVYYNQVQSRTHDELSIERLEQEKKERRVIKVDFNKREVVS